MCLSGFKKFGAEKRHVKFAQNQCTEKKTGGCYVSTHITVFITIVLLLND